MLLRFAPDGSRPRAEHGWMFGVRGFKSGCRPIDPPPISGHPARSPACVVADRAGLQLIGQDWVRIRARGKEVRSGKPVISMCSMFAASKKLGWLSIGAFPTGFLHQAGGRPLCKRSKEELYQPAASRRRGPSRKRTPVSS